MSSLLRYSSSPLILSHLISLPSLSTASPTCLACSVFLAAFPLLFLHYLLFLVYISERKRTHLTCVSSSLCSPLSSSHALVSLQYLSLLPFHFHLCSLLICSVSSLSLLCTLHCPSPHCYSSFIASSDIYIFCSPSPPTSSPHFFITCHPTSLLIYFPLHSLFSSFLCLLSLFNLSSPDYDHAPFPSSPSFLSFTCTTKNSQSSFFISFLLIFFLFMFLCVTCTLMFFQNFQMRLTFSLILSLMYFLRLVAPMLFSFLHVLPFSIFTYMYASASSSVTSSNLFNSLLPSLCQPSSLLCIFLKFILFFNTSLVPPLTDFLYTPSSSPLFFHLQHPARLPLNPEETGVLKLST